MSEMDRPVVEIGEKLHIITRRNYADDLHRHFAGTVEAIADGAMRLHGYTFAPNASALDFKRMPEVHTLIFPIADAQLIVNVLPPHVEMQNLQYRRVDGRLLLVDGEKVILDINEFGGID